jgi:hypothetical protein
VLETGQKRDRESVGFVEPYLRKRREIEIAGGESGASRVDVSVGGAESSAMKSGPRSQGTRSPGSTSQHSGTGSVTKEEAEVRKG